jgi:cobalt-zinc-cadmium efflux system membrane fusion protein
MTMNEKLLGAAALAVALSLTGCGGKQDAHDGHGHGSAEARPIAAEKPDEGADHEQHGDDAHGGEHGDGEEGEPDFARVAPERAGALGIVIAEATGGAVAETVTLTGRLIIDPKRVAAVRARFPGPVVRVHKEVGESVARGEPLADVESNESLTVYTVRSPLAGVVLERMTNVGDVAGTDALYRVGDVTDLQAELKAFPSQRAALSVGAPARVQLGEGEVTGKVVAIAPQVEGHTQALDVRVALQQPKGQTLVPGQFVTGIIEHGRGDAGVAVPFEAVQRLDGREVVFVAEAAGFRARPVEVGRRGATLLELRRGLQPGERFAAKGAFLLKAEIGKNEAAHEH